MMSWLAHAALVLTVLFISLAGMFAAFASAQRRRRIERNADVATLERAEAWLIATDDEPPPVPPAIPVEMRDPAFQRRQARVDDLVETALQGLHIPPGMKVDPSRLLSTQQLLAEPLVTDRRFTLLTHCQHGHVGDHWLGRITPEHVERICRFERCGATWLEKT